MSEQFYQKQENKGSKAKQQIIFQNDTHDIKNGSNHEEDIGNTLLKIHKKKIGQLQNKACFFQGQINPLFVQNQKVKEQLIKQNRVVIVTTQLLRNLLPIGTDPARKLKLQMANLQQISEMIKGDWNMMKQYIAQLQEKVRNKDQQIQILQQTYKSTVQTYEQNIKRIIEQNCVTVAKLEQLNRELQDQVEKQKQSKIQQLEKLKQRFESRLKRSEQIQREFSHYRSQMSQKCKDYQKAMSRLRGQIQSNLVQFQESKKNLKQIYDRIMQEKIKQVSQSYEMMIRVMQNQKIDLIQQIEKVSEEFKSVIQSKENQIAYLNNAREKLKQQIQQAKDQIYSKKQLIQEYYMQIKKKQQQIHMMQEDKKVVQRQFQEKEKKWMAQIQDLRGDKQALYRKLQETIQQSNQKIKKLQKETAQLSQDVRKKDYRIKQMQKNMTQTSQQFQKRIRSLQQEWILKVTAIQVQAQRLGKQLQSKTQELDLTIKQHQGQISSLNKQHQDRVKEIQKIFEERTQKLIKVYQQKIVDEKKVFDERVMSMRAQTAKQIKQIEKRFEQQTEKRIKFFKQQALELKAKIQNLGTECQKLSKQKQELRQQMTNQVNALQFKLFAKQIQQKKLQQERQQQKRKLQKQIRDKIESYEKQIIETNRLYKMEMSKMQEEMMKQISMLKQANNIYTIEDQYRRKIQILKQDAQKQRKRIIDEYQHRVPAIIDGYEAKIKDLTRDYQIKLKTETSAWQRKFQTQQRDFNAKIAQQQNKFHNDMIILAQKLQHDIVKLNDDLIQEKDAHQMSKMTRQQKIQYLSNRIKGLRDQVTAKEQELIDLQFKISQMNRTLEKMDQIVKKRIRERQEEMQNQKKDYFRQCSEKIQKNSIQCRIKIKKVQQERIRNAHSLYEQFLNIKNSHEQKYQSLQQKYYQLQKVCQERPSRAQDLTKIKTLMQEQSKLNIEIAQAHKKVAASNQIVKYLSLELDNYKDTYDIFGPQDKEYLNVSPNSKHLLKSYGSNNNIQSGNYSSQNKDLNSSGAESPIKSVLSSFKRDIRIKTEDSAIKKQTQSIQQRQRQENEVKKFQLFPQIIRPSQFEMYQDAKQYEPSEAEREIYQKPSLKSKLLRRKYSTNKNDQQGSQILQSKQKKIKRQKNEDKSNQIIANAQQFLGSLGRQKKPAQIVQRNQSYGKRSRHKASVRKSSIFIINNQSIGKNVSMKNK